MNKEEFWKTIESVNHSVPDGNHEMVAKQMCEELLHYSPQDILDWHLILREYTNAAYRNDLWAACTALPLNFPFDSMCLSSKFQDFDGESKS